MLLFPGIIFKRLYHSNCTLDLLKNTWIGLLLANLFMVTGFNISTGGNRMLEGRIILMILLIFKNFSFWKHRDHPNLKIIWYEEMKENPQGILKVYNMSIFQSYETFYEI